jgi:signal transduction histidine kinase/CheY-like chemotaxis protein
MIASGGQNSERVLILAPLGRDAQVAAAILGEAGIPSKVSADLTCLTEDLKAGAAAALVVEEALHNRDIAELASWIDGQPAWSDMPFVLLTQRGGGLERNPAAGRLTEALGNVSFLERPFHPTTLVSVMRTALRSRRRQYEARERAAALREGEERLRLVNATLERRVEERTAELREAETALRHAQKMEAIGQLTGGVAHDFNNLLTVLSGGLQIFDRNTDPERRARILSSMRQAVERGAGLTRQLLAFSRSHPLAAEPVDLRRQIGGMRELLDRALAGDVQVRTEFGEDLWPAHVDPNELEFALLNLCVNARDAMPNGGSIVISADNDADVQDGELSGDYVRLVVSDSGTGMSPELVARVFEPFFTTKEIGKGSGLGLAQVYGFARQSRGAVRIESREGVGTRVVLHLPRALTTAASTVPSVVAGATQSHGHVLLVEDDEAVAALAVEMLQDLGYRVRREASAASALSTLKRDRSIELIFSDVMMPGGMNGVELARAARKMRPDVPVVLTSGFAEAAAVDAAKAGITLLPKPYKLESLSEALRTVAAQRVEVPAG